MTAPVPRIIGVLNLGAESFFDGGRYTRPEDAVRQADALARAGAFAVELGPASSHPRATPVSAEQEIARLEPVLEALRGRGMSLGVDSFHPDTQRFALRHGATLLNDIRGFDDPSVYDVLAAASCTLVVMHSVLIDGRSASPGAEAHEVLTSMYDFFEARIARLEAAGIARERMVLDPGMGLFLGTTAEPSLLALRKLTRLREAFGLPVLVSVSNKSFLGALTGRAVHERAAATLAAELYAADHGADYIRTHDVQALRDALTVRAALTGPDPTEP